jgi:hypothetical protein
MGKKTSEKADDNLREFKAGDRVKVNMHRGRIVEGRLRLSLGRRTAGFVWKRDRADLFAAGRRVKCADGNPRRTRQRVSSITTPIHQRAQADHAPLWHSQECGPWVQLEGNL